MVKDDSDFKILNMPYSKWKEDVDKLIENMQYGSARITGIVSELKTYIRSHEEEERRPEYIQPVIDNVMTLVGKQVRKTVKTFDVIVKDSLPKILMDPGKLEQVLINLIINAGQAVDKDDSRVRITVGLSTKNEGYIEILVEDNGIGIPDDIIDKIFDPFFTTKGRESGTGLGLGISQRIIEEHDGTLMVKSKMGVGTTFIIELPIYQEELKQ